MLVAKGMNAQKSSLIIGASGLIGSNLYTTLQCRREQVIGTYLSNPLPGLESLDVSDEAAIERLLDRVQPGIVYFPAANPNVEWIEANPEAARAVNVTAPQRFIRRLENSGVVFVYYSTEYVFDGVDGPYTENDVPHPLSVYGQHKWEMEQFVQETLPDTLVLRVTVVYGWEARGKNFAHRMVNNFRSGNMQLRVPVDQVSSPSYAPNVAAASVELVQAGESGTFHVCGDALANRYEFACAIADTFDLPKSGIVPVKTDELVQKAARPLRAGMIVTKAQSRLKTPLLGYVAGLQAMKSTEIQRASVVSDLMR